MSNTIDSVLRDIVDRAVMETREAVRASIMQEIHSLVGVHPASSTPPQAKAQPAKTKAQPAKKMSKSAAAASTPRPGRGAPIDDTAHVERVIAFVRDAEQPPQRAEIKQALGLATEDADRVLLKARASNRLRIEGARRAARYYYVA